MKGEFLELQKKGNKEKYNLSAWTIDKIEKILPIEEVLKMDEEQIIDLMIKLKPSSVKVLSNYLYIIGQYGKFIGDEKFYNISININKTKLFEECQKKNHIQKFISYSEFNDLIYNIEMYEEMNTLYYTTLLRCIYEGIYSDDMSVITNLRASDIHGNIVTLREDNGHVYDLKISDELVENLLELSTTNVWERKNRSGTFNINVQGKHFDSCFKIEKRADGENYRFSYFSRIRKISKNYMDYSIRPLYLFISGIMYRIKNQLEVEGYNLKFAFIEKKKFSLTSKIINEELQRCNYSSKSKNFRQLINGFVDVF